MAESPEATLESPGWEGAPSPTGARKRWVCTGLQYRVWVTSVSWFRLGQS